MLFFAKKPDPVVMAQVDTLMPLLSAEAQEHIQADLTTNRADHELVTAMLLTAGVERLLAGAGRNASTEDAYDFVQFIVDIAAGEVVK